MICATKQKKSEVLASAVEDTTALLVPIAMMHMINPLARSLPRNKKRAMTRLASGSKMFSFLLGTFRKTYLGKIIS